MNGRKAFLRGTLECAIFPKTGHPPTDVDSWRRIVRIAKAHGLNMIRFHSWCPPEAAFTAADEEGFYYQVEVASWANSSTRLGAGLPIDEWLYRETERILKAYGNHPSFVLLPYGNEPAGRDAAFLGRWVEHWKARDPRRLYTSASGWPQIPENQFHVTPRPAHPGLGRGARVARQREAARDAHRLPRLRARADGARDQPRDRPVVRLPEPRRAREVHRLPEGEELRHLRGLAGRERDGGPGRRLPARLGEAAGAPLQGGHRVGAPHAGHGRLPAARPPRLPGAGHGARRRPRPVLGLEGLRHAPRRSGASRARPCRSRGSTGASSRRRRRWRPTSRSRTSARAARRREARLAARRRATGGPSPGARCRPGTCRSTTGSPWAA